MPEVEEAQTTLRDTLADALDEIAPETPSPETPSAPVETAQQAADRVRDEKGRFAQKAETKPQASATPQKFPAVTPTTTAADLAPEVAPIKRPSTWKKELWESFDKLDPQVRDYIMEREGQYAKGVSTYKSEAERAQGVMKAMEPFMPELQKYNIAPEQWITNLGNAHRALAFSAPQEKLGIAAKLLQDYGIPLNGLLQYVQAGGQPQYSPQNFVPQQPQQDVRAVVQEAMLEQQAVQSVAQFKDAKDGSGNLLHPHYETVVGTMQGLLQAGQAQTLDDAYAKAIRLDDSLWQQEQQRAEQQRAANAAADLKAKQEQARTAKRAAGSVRSNAPTGTVVSTSTGNTGLRGTLESAVDSVMGGGRV